MDNNRCSFELWRDNKCFPMKASWSIALDYIKTMIVMGERKNASLTVWFE